MTPRRPVALLVTAASATVVAALTLQPVAQSSHMRAWCALCNPLAGIDVLLNTLLFLPLGAGLGLAGLPRRRALAAIVAATTGVELLQFFVVPGRVASVGDIVSNAAGGALGVVAADHWRSIVLPAPAAARRLTLAGALGWLAVLAATAWLLTPTGRRAPHRLRTAPSDNGARFRGVVLAASVDGVATPPFGADGTALRARLGGDVRIETVVTPGDAPAREVPIVDLVDEHGRSIVALGQERYNVTFRVRRHATALRLRTPVVVVSEALPPPMGPRRAADAVRLTGWTERFRMYVSARSRYAWSARVLELRPTIGWALIIPFEYTLTPVSRRFTAIWLGVLILPAAYWAARGTGRGSRPRSGTRAWGDALARGLAPPGIIAAALAIGLVALPRSLGLPAAYPWEWAGAAAGVGLGWCAGLASRWVR